MPNNEKLNLLKHFDLGSLGPLQISPGLQNESDYDRRPTMTHDPSSIDAESRRANERRLAAIMFSDIVGYTAMTRSNEELALELLEEHRGLLAPIFQKHRGRVVKTIGDAYLVEFTSALDALDCAVEIQQSLTRRNSDVTPVRKLDVRVGIHLGEVTIKGGDVYGDTVNVASRIEKLADPAGVAISAAVYEQVKGKTGHRIEEMGRFTLKNVEGMSLIYKVDPVKAENRPSRDEHRKGRIAVLPLLNISGSKSDDFLADGLTEELISCLSTLSGLKVIARTTTMKYKGTKKGVVELGSELGVGAILEGSIRRAGNKLRVTVQLVDTENEENLWAENFNRELDDVLAIQQEIGTKVVESLKHVLGKGTERLERWKVTKNGEAYILYLEGRYHLAKHTQAEVIKALELFRKATEIDPDFASAYAMMAQCHLFLGFFGFITPQEGFDRAKPLLSKALELDKDQYVAHMLMGRYLIDREWNWVGAEAEFRRAIELNPNSAEAHYRYALLLHNLGKHDEAIEEAKVAEELDPLSVSVTQVYGTILYYALRYGEAILTFQRAIEIDPGAALAHNNIGLAYFQTGDADRGLAEVKKAIELDPDNEMFKVDLCYIYTKLGKTAEAASLVEEAEKRSHHGHVSPVAFAGMCACLGKEDEAMQWLEKAFALHSPYLSSLKTERWFDPLRKREEFTGLLKRIHLA
ncbi:MAG: tetratricopeptide repeat protein [Nitrososphaerota archaeon]|nr:tetratricopeptide repeat protein [Nitrososphaerota archaeon]